MKYDVIVIGGGLSGLTAGSLLSKRGLKVGVIDKNYKPGGSCGTFKRNEVIFDQGSAMLYGFGEKGFNAHRFVFNCLEEPIDIIRHDLLYRVNFKGEKINFWPDLDAFIEELARIFPSEKESIKKFYRDMGKMYQHVMVENPNYTTPDETDPKEGLKSLLKHPISYAKFLGYMNKSAKSLLMQYFKDPEIFKFFDKLTSTYCYATVEESPAILAAIMFVDNHVGGSYYPAGSTVFLPGKLEKVIEENQGDMILEKEVVEILFTDEKPSGVTLSTGETLKADNIIYSGTVWNLYGKLIDPKYSSKERQDWAANQIPTYPSVVLYATVDASVIPKDTQPVEMLVGNPDRLDESEVTVYMFSIDDKTLCPDDTHVLMAIGPTFENWDIENSEDYKKMKVKEAKRLLDVLEKKFPGIKSGLRYSEVATPRTIERYTNKNGGAVAGPKQMLGQHMFHRLHTKSEWGTLFCCGESTVMGTGTPTVTTSGLSAANAILKKLNMEPYVIKENMDNYVNIIPKPFFPENRYANYPEATRQVMIKSAKCHYCENPGCMKDINLDIRGIMRRVTVGNFVGARKLMGSFLNHQEEKAEILNACQRRCNRYTATGESIAIKEIIEFFKHKEGKVEE